MAKDKEFHESAFESAVEERRQAMHRQMLSSVSHDLKTPLASIIGSLEIHQRLGANLPPQKKVDLIETALHEAYRLDSFITNILDMGKLESGMVRPRPEITDIPALLSQAIKKVDYRLHNAKVEFPKANGIQPVSLDGAMLTRALGLILDNAVKFGPREGLIILLRYGVDGDVFWLEVEDNGPGVPQGQEEHIFDKYTRFSREDTQNAGTGLGLPICRALCRLQSGDVKTVKNTKQNGAIFRIEIPATQAA